MSRYRNRTTAYEANWGSGTLESEYIYESSYPGSCSCLHQRGPFYWIDRSDGAYVHNLPYLQAIKTIIEQQIWPLGFNLNWEKLPSSTQAGIIQILAEIDDTLNIFLLKFWTRLSYGSWTWGVMPFMSDLEAVCNAIANLSKSIDNFLYEDSYGGSLDVVLLTDARRELRATLDYVFHLTGSADYSFQHPVSVALDWLGLHPDLATAWDLIPLSFVVDYLFPIGDFLQSFRQGGWVKVVNFSGWKTLKVKISGDVVIFPPYTGTGFLADGKYFFRTLTGTALVVQPDYSLPSFTLPSVREMLNMLYLLLQARRK